MKEDSVENRAIKLVTEHYHQAGFKVENVSRARGEHGGYDLLATKGNESLKLEVKGCTRPYGIPDPYYTEFDPDSKRLIADVLCVVYFFEDGKAPELALIPREAIPPEFVQVKYGYRISGKFKNAKTIRKFVVPQQ